MGPWTVPQPWLVFSTGFPQLGSASAPPGRDAGENPPEGPAGLTGAACAAETRPRSAGVTRESQQETCFSGVETARLRSGLPI